MSLVVADFPDLPDVSDLPPGPDIIMMSSTGDAAEYFSHMLGVYVAVGEYKGSRYYRQLHTVKRGNEHFAYKTSSHWYISKDLGSNGWLRSDEKTETIPVKKWKYWRIFWCDDSDLKFTVYAKDSPPEPCQEIEISATNMQTDCDGVYTPTSDYCNGRPVYINTNNKKVLLVDHEYLKLCGCWAVLDYDESAVDTARMRSGSAAPDLCPAHPRSKRGWHKFTQYDWKYMGHYENAKIIVKCKKHH